MYFGGGTPSLLSPAQIAELLSQLRLRYGLQDGAEITLEMDPASFDQHQLKEVLAFGVNRISLGGKVLTMGSWNNWVDAIAPRIF